jgi:hypothetical protein
VATELIAAVTPKTKIIPSARSIIPELNMLFPPGEDEYARRPIASP